MVNVLLSSRPANPVSLGSPEAQVHTGGVSMDLA
jgi:hypothetical protein